MKTLKNWYCQFREWDNQRRFGCEFGDFLILLLVTFAVGLISILVIGGAKGYVLLIATIIACQCLSHRNPF